MNPAVFYLERVRFDQFRELEELRRCGSNGVEIGVLEELFGGLPFRRNNLQHLLQEVENLVGEPIYVVHAVLLDALSDVAFQIWRVKLYVHVFVL